MADALGSGPCEKTLVQVQVLLPVPMEKFMLPQSIKLWAKTKKVLILFDMDGTIVEYGANEKHDIIENRPNFYYEKRPLKTMLKVVKNLSKIKNVTIGILSNCYYPEQEQDKIKWLHKFVPFVNFNHVYFNVYSTLSFKKEEKNLLKANVIKTISGFDKILLIEDNHEIIKATNNVIPNTSHHLSELIK